jgi:hypothetical protein
VLSSLPSTKHSWSGTGSGTYMSCTTHPQQQHVTNGIGAGDYTTVKKDLLVGCHSSRFKLCRSIVTQLAVFDLVKHNNK